MMRLQSEYVSVNSIPIENIHEAVELVYDRNTSMVNIVGVYRLNLVGEMIMSEPLSGSCMAVAICGATIFRLFTGADFGIVF